MPSAILQQRSEPLRIGKIICVGRNYAAHALEMKAEIPTFPVLFLKPPSAVIGNDDSIVIPSISKDLQHEVEMTVLVGKKGKNIPREHAYEHIAGYGIGLDMTLRDVQQEAKNKGLPWTLSKGFDTSAPLSEFTPSSEVSDPHNLEVKLEVNGSLRQIGNTKDLIFKVDQLLSIISQFFTLEKGDVIYTGTPPGVHQVVSGDSLYAELSEAGGKVLASLKVHVK